MKTITRSIFVSISATVVTLGLVLTPTLTATPVQQSETETFASFASQTLVVSSISTPATLKRDGYTFGDPPPSPPPVVVPEPVEGKQKTAPPDFIPDPGSAQAYAQEQVTSRGWDQNEFNCLVALWNRESGWRANAENSSSGAYGIPQALPGSKMASAGDDWQTNAETQINWGLGYIQGRYGTPCAAWAHSEEKNWY